MCPKMMPVPGKHIAGILLHSCQEHYMTASDSIVRRNMRWADDVEHACSAGREHDDRHIYGHMASQHVRMLSDPS